MHPLPGPGWALKGVVGVQQVARGDALGGRKGSQERFIDDVGAKSSFARAYTPPI